METALLPGENPSQKRAEVAYRLAERSCLPKTDARWCALWHSASVLRKQMRRAWLLDPPNPEIGLFGPYRMHEERLQKRALQSGFARLYGCRIDAHDLRSLNEHVPAFQPLCQPSTYLPAISIPFLCEGLAGLGLREFGVVDTSGRVVRAHGSPSLAAKICD
jgi:hypothetical protein